MLEVIIIVAAGLLTISKISIADVALEEFANGNREFSSDVYAILANKSDHTNLIFSPFSAQIVLSLTSEGARNQTLRQLVSALHLPCRKLTRDAIKQLNFNISTETFKLLSANKLYIAQNFQVLESFLSVSQQVYRAEVQNVDFGQNQQTADVINKWVEENTNNKIRNLIASEDISAATRLVLVNALYLNAKWVLPFKENLTRNGTFYLYNGTTKEVQMMRSDTTKSSTYKYMNSSTLGVAFLQLDFEKSNLSTTFVLPSARNGLAYIENNLNYYLEQQNYSVKRVEVVLPKFEITSDPIDLKTVLEQLGVTLLFSNADLSGLSLEQGLYVDKVVQKAFINVTESGVEAAAATAVSITKSLVEPAPSVSFIADHPFVYYISDRVNGIVYFVGRYTGI